MGEGELKYHLSTLHFRPSASPPPFLHPPFFLRPPSRLPQLPAGSEQEGGKTEKQGQGEDTRRLGLEGLFYGG